MTKTRRPRTNALIPFLADRPPVRLPGWNYKPSHVAQRVEFSHDGAVYVMVVTHAGARELYSLADGLETFLGLVTHGTTALGRAALAAA